MYQNTLVLNTEKQFVYKRRKAQPKNVKSLSERSVDYKCKQRQTQNKSVWSIQFYEGKHYPSNVQMYLNTSLLKQKHKANISFAAIHVVRRFTVYMFCRPLAYSQNLIMLNYLVLKQCTLTTTFIFYPSGLKVKLTLILIDN